MRAFPRAAALIGLALVLAIGTLGCTPDPGAEPSLQALQQQLAEQEARNEASRRRIGEVEAMLASEVCTKTDAAAALLPAAAEAPPPR
jgi:hypothetical protein